MTNASVPGSCSGGRLCGLEALVEAQLPNLSRPITALSVGKSPSLCFCNGFKAFSGFDVKELEESKPERECGRDGASRISLSA